MTKQSSWASFRSSILACVICTAVKVPFTEGLSKQAERCLCFGGITGWSDLPGVVSQYRRALTQCDGKGGDTGTSGLAELALPGTAPPSSPFSGGAGQPHRTRQGPTARELWCLSRGACVQTPAWLLESEDHGDVRGPEHSEAARLPWPAWAPFPGNSSSLVPGSEAFRLGRVPQGKAAGALGDAEG